MGGCYTRYQVVYRGEQLSYYLPDQWVFFQRPLECGGGYWLGRTMDGFYQFGPEKPVSLHQGLVFLVQTEAVETEWDAFNVFDEDFKLEP